MQRTKEIGIRKILGATVTYIVILLSKDLLKLVVLGFLIAAPIAWFAMNRWLENYAYAVNIGPGIIIITGIAAITIAVVTICGQALKAAFTNPVESLRNE